jgi:hypothetical protein
MNHSITKKNKNERTENPEKGLKKIRDFKKKKEIEITVGLETGRRILLSLHQHHNLVFCLSSAIFDKVFQY